MRDHQRAVMVCLLFFPLFSSSAVGQKVDNVVDSAQSPAVLHEPHTSVTDKPTRQFTPEELSEPRFGPFGLSTKEADKLRPPRPTPNLPTDATSVQLVKRLQARWAALIASDFDRAYTFETPEFRAKTDAKTFHAQFGPFVTWHGIEPIAVQYPTPDTAMLSFLLDYSFPVDGTDHLTRTERFAQERWIRRDGEWWHQSQSVTIPGMAPENSSQKP
ncbi:nuclear transport factor 2 family protein [Thiospirillum jenense]|uniref:Nuclear transport factor 2 family protein n=1 Tax=Thiospirillum jenense TaxID=1653858 RepID=A0A839HFX8_9GAMM|nr:nuclear transport factor 2 family protein [Thiospirillum jenense]MBB1126950.1 nuclear transport factor 2 family protein [Thiospirillum jenense]